MNTRSKNNNQFNKIEIMFKKLFTRTSRSKRKENYGIFTRITNFFKIETNKGAYVNYVSTLVRETNGLNEV